MSIDMEPAAVLRGADAVGAAAEALRQVGRDGDSAVGGAGNPGFTTTAAIRHFTTSLAVDLDALADAAARTAAQVEAAALRMRAVDDLSRENAERVGRPLTGHGRAMPV